MRCLALDTPHGLPQHLLAWKFSQDYILELEPWITSPLYQTVVVYCSYWCHEKRHSYDCHHVTPATLTTASLKKATSNHFCYCSNWHFLSDMRIRLALACPNVSQSAASFSQSDASWLCCFVAYYLCSLLHLSPVSSQQCVLSIVFLLHQSPVILLLSYEKVLSFYLFLYVCAFPEKTNSPWNYFVCDASWNRKDMIYRTGHVSSTLPLRNELISGLGDFFSETDYDERR